MIKSIKINSNKEDSINNVVKEFLHPEKIHLAIGFENKEYEILVKKGDYIKVGQVVSKANEGIEPNIHSSVSGTVIEVTKEIHSNGKKIEAIIIENDKEDNLHEDCFVEDTPSKFTSKQIIEKMKKWSVVGRGGSGFPTYVKYQTNENINHIILNGVECEPNISADYMIMKHKTKEIIQGLKYMIKAANAKEGIIVIKNNKQEIQSLIEKEIENESNIKILLVKDKYPNGWEKVIVKKVTKMNYKEYPNEVGCIVNNVTTAYDVYKAVKFNLPVINKYVTISGDKVKEPYNVLTKLGTMSSDLVEEFLDEDTIVVSGGPMTGNVIKGKNFCITRRNNSILLYNINGKQISTSICIRCGKCSDNCPVNLIPALIKESLDNKDKQLMKDLGSLNCISCGICSYVCPSAIELTTSVNKAKLFARKVK